MTRLEVSLDELHGKCELRDPEFSVVVAENLLKFDGDRYQLGGFVVMPNHVHVLVCFRKDINMLDQCHNWKHYTSRRINSLLGSTGPFWQSESFDHLVRDFAHFEKFQNYIRDNPIKSKLKPGEYRLHRPNLGAPKHR